MPESITDDVNSEFPASSSKIRMLELLAQRDAAPAGKPRRTGTRSAVIALFIGLLALGVLAYLPCRGLIARELEGTAHRGSWRLAR